MKNKKTTNTLKKRSMARYLDPKSDLIFKRIFGEHPDLLLSFLNALMPFEPDRYIEEVEYLSPEMVPENPTKKLSIVDVRCKDNLGRIFIIEMQMYWSSAFYNRVVFNAGKAYVRQLGRNENFNLLQPVYTLAILNQNFDHKTNKFYHHYQIVNRENTDEIIPGLEFVLIELEKFCPETISDRKMTVLWLRFLKEVDEKMRMLPPELIENEYIRKAAELCEEWSFTDDELYFYDKYWDNVRVERTLLDDATERWLKKGEEIGEKIGEKKGEKIGLKKGLEKGLEKGLKKGLEKGLEKGRAEGRAEIEKQIVMNSHNAGLSIEDIVKITGLSAKRIIEIIS
jgi:predicted transposase/invertase (TIGR01784 family)